jgi:hypothetical protein
VKTRVGWVSAFEPYQSGPSIGLQTDFWAAI